MGFFNDAWLIKKQANGKSGNNTRKIFIFLVTIPGRQIFSRVLLPRGKISCKKLKNFNYLKNSYKSLKILY